MGWPLVLLFNGLGVLFWLVPVAVGYSIYDVLRRTDEEMKSVGAMSRDAWVLLMIFMFPLSQLYWYLRLRPRLRADGPR